MNQVEMFYRPTDPETSKLAAQQMFSSGAMDTQRAMVYDILVDNQGLTSRELADLSEGDMHQQRQIFSRRLPDLKNLGLAKQGLARVCSSCNRKCVTWYLAEEF
jgi:hypothetical protein